MAEIQQPNIVGNFLAAYSSGLERQQQQQDAAYQRQRQAKADQMTEQKYNFDMEQGQIDRAINMLKAEEDFFSTVPDNVTAETLQPYVHRYSQAFGIPVEQLAHITPDKIPGIKERSGALLKRLQVQKAQADIAQSYAAARASNRQGQGGGGLGNAPSGYQWVRDANGNLSQAPIKGGPADPAKLQPGELSKIRNSNKQIDELENSLASYINNLEKTTPMGRLFTRGPEVSKVETGHTDLLMQMKNLYELGVLNGPDYFLMTKIVEDPTSLMQLARGTDGLKAQTDTVKSIISRARNLNNDRLQQAGVDAYRNREQPTATTGAPPAAGAANPKTFRYDANGNRVQ